MHTTRDVINHCKQYFSGALLDVGAGNAKYRGLIQPSVSAYTTCDMFPGKNIDVVCDVDHLTFADGAFDTVISTQVLEHVPHPWRMIAEVSRVLKPGGICMVSAPFLVPYHADPHDYFRYTPEGLRSLMEDNGFEVVECASYGKIGVVLSELTRFTFFSPYERNESRFARVSTRGIQAIGRGIDTLFKTKHIYANVYCVARKKH